MEELCYVSLGLEKVTENQRFERYMPSINDTR